MATPDFQSTMQPLLKAVEDGEIHAFRQVMEQVINHFEMNGT